MLDHINTQKAEKEQKWQSAKDAANSAGLSEPVQEIEEQSESTHPDWSQSPIQVSLTVLLSRLN